MLRNALLACSVAIPLGFAGTAPALADTDVDIHFGVPFYTYQVGPRYRYHNDYGWYDYDRYPRFRSGYGDNVRGRLSCGEARRMVRANGFRNVRARDCDGRTYSFRAMRNGRSVTVYVNSLNGRMWRA